MEVRHHCLAVKTLYGSALQYAGQFTFIRSGSNSVSLFGRLGRIANDTPQSYTISPYSSISPLELALLGWAGRFAGRRRPILRTGLWAKVIRDGTLPPWSFTSSTESRVGEQMPMPSSRCCAALEQCRIQKQGRPGILTRASTRTWLRILLPEQFPQLPISALTVMKPFAQTTLCWYELYDHHCFSEA